MMQNKEEYFKLMETRPELFLDDPALRIITGEKEIEETEKAEGLSAGILYKGRLGMVLSDLVHAPGGKVFAYERLVANNTGAVLIVPECNGKYVLIKHFRHSIRDFSWEFPRGFGEAGLKPEENARKETREELGIAPESVEFLGTSVMDSGISGSMVYFYRCRVPEVRLRPGNEGIVEYRCVSFPELAGLIRTGEITDGFTIAAFGMMVAKEMREQNEKEPCGKENW